MNKARGFIFSREWLLFVLTRQLVLHLMSSDIEELVISLLVDSVGRNDGVKNKFCDIFFRAQQTKKVHESQTM